MAEHENVGGHTPIDPTMLEVPDVVDHSGGDHGFPEQPEYEVRLRHGFGPGGGHSSIFYRNDPLKVAGWKGDLFPFKLNIRHILPIMSDRIHWRPRPGRRSRRRASRCCALCRRSRCPDLNAEELPSYRRNIDMDEVIPNHADEDPSG